MYVTVMMKQLLILVFCALPLLAQSLSVETFTTLDREIAGLMDAWVNLTEGRSNESAGLFMAGTAILRAETALEAASSNSSEALPSEVHAAWVTYLKSSADCIVFFREAVGQTYSAESEEVLLTSFTRWETSGEEFLESVQSTR